MANKIYKTEHNGPAGRNSRDGQTKEIKAGARKMRRRNDRKAVSDTCDTSDLPRGEACHACGLPSEGDPFEVVS